jgi:hypothetical protein
MQDNGRGRLRDLWKGDFHVYNEEWLFRFAHIRAIEWCGLPLFAMQPIAPVALVWFPAWAVIAAVLALSWVWIPIRYRLLGVRFGPALSAGETIHYGQARIKAHSLIRVADMVQWFVHLKWPISLAAGIWLYREGRVSQALIAGLWPVVTMLLVNIAAGNSYIGVAQKCFLLALGFEPMSGDPDSSRTNEFHRPNCEHSIS